MRSIVPIADRCTARALGSFASAVAYNTNKETSAPPAKLAGVDKLGNLVVSSPESPDPQSEGLRFRAADLSKA